jgi:hypothetical protein
MAGEGRGCVPSSDGGSGVQWPAWARREEGIEPALLLIAAGALRDVYRGQSERSRGGWRGGRRLRGGLLDGLKLKSKLEVRSFGADGICFR